MNQRGEINLINLFKFAGLMLFGALYFYGMYSSIALALGGWMAWTFGAAFFIVAFWLLIKKPTESSVNFA